jgi:membrane fusion protein (multidrug efflux system)
MAKKITALASESKPQNWQGVLYGAAAIAAMSLFVAGCGKSAPPAAAAPPPMPVSVITVRPSDVSIKSDWVATLDGNVNAQIQPQVSGYLIQQTYREGSAVAKGQVLFEIDPRPFQAVVDQAQAQLEQTKAAYGLTQTNVNRDTPLAAVHAIAQSQLDTDKAQMAQAEATVKSAEATLATAKLNLGFTHVRSLINGIAGQATTQVGNLVSTQSVLTSVSQLDPIRVYFSLSDSEYLALTKRLKHGGTDLLKSADAVPLTLTLSDGNAFPQKGRITFVDRQMNQQTGAIRVAATFPNPGNVLRPGQFARVSASTEVQHNVILVPQAAVADLQGQKQVFTVTANNTVHVANVTLGTESGDNVIVLSGLPPGATVVMDNIQKLREGAPVAPHAAAPTPQAAPNAGGN